jgi:pimeloyl-ACP methyl ester carboxylesterase
VSTTTSALSSTVVTTRRGIEATVLTGGPDGGEAVVAFHGFSGPLGGEPALVRLADAGFRVFAPVWPGYSDTGGEGQIDDMLDFALHGADVVEALGLGPAHGGAAPHLVGHSMGGMIAAEMAALAPYGYAKVVLVDPLGLWLDEHPIADIYSLLPYEFPPLLFHDAAVGTALLTGGGVDFSDAEAIQRFLIGNNRRLGTAGKILFPIPNRRLSKRLYRITNGTLLLWGDDDRLLPAPYADAWSAALPHARRATLADAGHMAPYEQPDTTADAITSFLRA